MKYCWKIIYPWMLVISQVLLLSFCAQTTPEEARTNPLDRAFDDNGFRLVLNYPVIANGTYKITWNDLVATGEDREIADLSFISGNLMSKAGSPTTTETSEIKNQAQVSGFSAIKALSNAAKSEFELGSINATTSYVLEIRYTSTENGVQTTKYMHSNVITFTP